MASRCFDWHGILLVRHLWSIFVLPGLSNNI